MRPETSFVIKPGQPEDAQRLSEVAHRAKSHWGYPPEWLSKWDADFTISDGYLTEHRIYVAWADNDAIGMCAIADRGHQWALEHVWVDPEHQGQHVGISLVRRALDHVRKTRPGIVTITADPHANGSIHALALCL